MVYSGVKTVESEAVVLGVRARFTALSMETSTSRSSPELCESKSMRFANSATRSFWTIVSRLCLRLSKRSENLFSRVWLVRSKTPTSFGDEIWWYPTVLILIWRVSRIVSTLFFISVLFCALVRTIQLLYAKVVQLSQLFESITSWTETPSSAIYSSSWNPRINAFNLRKSTWNCVVLLQESTISTHSFPFATPRLLPPSSIPEASV